jgi:hypothetical protein
MQQGNITSEPAYREGFEAYRAGDPCPYPSRRGYSYDRFLWWRGFLEARFPTEI